MMNMELKDDGKNPEDSRCMKKEYTAPDFETIRFEVEDIITASSLATSTGDNTFTAPTGWWT